MVGPHPEQIIIFRGGGGGGGGVFGIVKKSIPKAAASPLSFFSFVLLPILVLYSLLSLNSEIKPESHIVGNLCKA